MLGCQLKFSSMLLGDNMAVVLNTNVPSSALKQKHQACTITNSRKVLQLDLLSMHILGVKITWQIF